jgi:hypothetical protein
MSWLFSQVLVEEYLGDTSLDGEQSAPLSGNSTQQAYCAPDKMTKFSRLSRFGMTYKPLTENRGEELLTLYLADFRAKTFQLQEKETDLTEKDQECGEKWHGLLARYDQDSHLWRTVQCSLLEDLNESLQTLPQWGMTVNGELYLRQTLVRPIKEKESGYWLTPNCMDSLPPRLPEALKKQYDNNRQGRTTHSTLREQVVYPPPNQMWPTPAARDYKGANSFKTTSEKISQGKRSHMGQLPNAIMMEEQASIGGTLNPTWVEWLMGFPLGWTDLKPLVMDKSLYVQQQHGNY